MAVEASTVVVVVSTAVASTAVEAHASALHGSKVELRTLLSEARALRAELEMSGAIVA